MSRWFRFYDCVLDDPKVQKLPPQLFKVWVNLLCVAARNDGTLPPIEDLAFAIRADESVLEADVADLEYRGLLDRYDNDLTPHNWKARQFQSDDSTTRVRRYREKARTNDGNGKCNVTVTPPDTDTDTDSSDANASDAGASDDDFPPDAFQLWYGEYPHKVGRSAAEKAFSRVRKAKSVAFDELMDGLRRYIRTKPPDRAWCNPATWLNQDRWADQPSNVEPLFQRGYPENAGKTRTVHDAAIALEQWVREGEHEQRSMLQIGSG